MGTQTEVIDIIFKTHAKEAEKAMKSFAKRARDVDGSLKVMTKVAKKEMSTIEKHIGGIQRKARAARGAMLGFSLSILFTGMALKRFGDQAARALINNFTQIADNSHIGMQAINGVSAAFSFLKFSIVDALAQTGVFQTFVEALINIVTWVGQLVAQYPGIALVAGVLIFLASVGGGLIMLAGQVGTLLVGLNGVGVTLTGLKAGISGFMTSLLSAALVFAIAWAMVKLLDTILNSKLNPTLKLVLLSLVAIVGIIGAGKAAAGLGLTASFGVVIAVIFALIWAFMKMKERLGTVKRTFMAFVTFIARIFATLLDTLEIIFFNPLAALWNGIASVFGGPTIQLNWNPLTGSRGKQIDEFRDQLLAEAARDRELAAAEEDKQRYAANAAYNAPDAGSSNQTVNISDESTRKIAEEIMGTGFVMPSVLQ